MKEINRSINFDAGIEQIVAFNEPNPARLPDTTQYLPGEGVYKQQLAEVLFPPSVEQSLVESFRPSVTARQLLTPPGFSSARGECCTEVEAAIEKYGDTPEGQKMVALEELLQDNEDLTNLLNTYRHLLHQA